MMHALLYKMMFRTQTIIYADLTRLIDDDVTGGFGDLIR